MKNVMREVKYEIYKATLDSGVFTGAYIWNLLIDSVWWPVYGKTEENSRLQMKDYLERLFK